MERGEGWGGGGWGGGGTGGGGRGGRKLPYWGGDKGEERGNVNPGYIRTKDGQSDLLTKRVIAEKKKTSTQFRPSQVSIGRWYYVTIALQVQPSDCRKGKPLKKTQGRMGGSRARQKTISGRIREGGRKETKNLFRVFGGGVNARRLEKENNTRGDQCGADGKTLSRPVDFKPRRSASSKTGNTPQWLSPR